MRDILFRGMGKHGEGWLFGSLMVLPSGFYGIVPAECYETTCDGSAYDFTYFEVDPATVGQYICNGEGGVKVFIGDIAEYEDGSIGTVMYDGNYALVRGKQLCNGEEFVEDIDEYTVVVGNIHERGTP